MRKTYIKPALDKREKLSAVTAGVAPNPVGSGGGNNR